MGQGQLGDSAVQVTLGQQRLTPVQIDGWNLRPPAFQGGEPAVRPGPVLSGRRHLGARVQAGIAVERCPRRQGLSLRLAADPGVGDRERRPDPTLQVILLNRPLGQSPCLFPLGERDESGPVFEHRGGLHLERAMRQSPGIGRPQAVQVQRTSAA